MECNRCGKCCKRFTLELTGFTGDEKLWLSYHEKCEIVGHILIVNVKCSHLKRKNQKYICDVHGTDKQPELCKAYTCDKGELNE